MNYSFPVLVVTDFSRVRAEFNRISFAPMEESKEFSFETAPLSFKLFLAGFVFGAIVLVIVAIIKEW